MAKSLKSLLSKINLVDVVVVLVLIAVLMCLMKKMDVVEGFSVCAAINAGNSDSVKLCGGYYQESECNSNTEICEGLTGDEARTRMLLTALLNKLKKNPNSRQMLMDSLNNENNGN